ncbi:filamin-B-like isoform X2 [Bolinopsis microptera]|uniref:filamin-B-like isoform X2 n=1 Tax=Bolinopsis microptera TaxID=2820187 RepID=UPI00307B05D5
MSVLIDHKVERGRFLEIQEMTFTRWCNSALNRRGSPLIDDIFIDLESGVTLLILLEYLTGVQLKYHKSPKSNAQKLENLSIALEFMSAEGINLTAMSNEEIMGGNVKLILGLVWMLIQKYHIQAEDAKRAMLDWIQAVIPESNIKNFTTDWNNGRALSALVETCLPGSIPDWNLLDENNAVENITSAMQTAEEELSIPALLAPDDMANPEVDELSIMTYVSCFNTQLFNNLLFWLRAKVPHRSIENLTLDWNNGVNLAYLVEALAPGSWENMDDVSPDTAEENVKTGLKIAYDALGVFPRIKVEEFMNHEITELNMATYMWQFRNSKITSGYAENTAQRCIASGLGLTRGTLGEPSKFTVHAGNAGVGELHVKISNPGSEPIVPLIEDLGLGEYSVTYVPNQFIDLIISVTWAEQHVPGSPFKAVVLGPPDATRCVVSGEGIHIARPGWPAEFLVNAQTAGVGHLTANIQGANSNPNVEIEEYAEGKFRGTYIAKESGDHDLFVYWCNEPVPGSPFLVHVEESLPPSAMIKTTGGRMLQIDTVHRAGESIELDVDTQEAGDGQLAAVAIGPKGDAVPVEIIANRNRTFTLKLLTSRGGRYLVNVYFNGSHIPNSPFKVRVCNPEAIWAEGPGLMDSFVGDQGDFQVFTRDAGHGTLSVRVNGPKDKFRVDMWKGAERTVNCRYNPEVAGKYTINIKWEDEHIKGSPFTIQVRKRPDNGSDIVAR